MALTLEDGQRLFETPDLPASRSRTTRGAGSTASSTRPRRRQRGLVHGPVRITLDGIDGQGGSGVEQIQYRINGGPPQLYWRPVQLATEGEHTLEFRSVDRAGNAETFKPIELKVDANAPTTTATTTRATSLEGGWYDREVTVTLHAGDGQGSGAEVTEYRVPSGDEWLPYESRSRSAPRACTRRVPLDRRRRQRRGRRSR